MHLHVLVWPLCFYFCRSPIMLWSGKSSLPTQISRWFQFLMLSFLCLFLFTYHINPTLKIIVLHTARDYRIRTAWKGELSEISHAINSTHNFEIFFPNSSSPLSTTRTYQIISGTSRSAHLSFEPRVPWDISLALRSRTDTSVAFQPNIDHCHWFRPR